jgi:hypothetical protein
MSKPEPPTLGQRLDRRARAALARRGEPARRLAARQPPAMRWAAPASRRLRVEADLPPAWDGEPDGDGTGFGRATAAAGPFPVELREKLRSVVGPGLERVVVHDGEADPAADAVASEHDAAAVTVGQQIFLRQGRFRPGSPHGRGLLAHEAVHTTLSTRPGAAWWRATQAGRAREEQAAHALGATVAAEARVGGFAVARVAPPGAAVPARRLRVRAGNHAGGGSGRAAAWRPGTVQGTGSSDGSRWPPAEHSAAAGGDLGLFPLTGAPPAPPAPAPSAPSAPSASAPPAPPAPPAASATPAPPAGSAAGTPMAAPAIGTVDPAPPPAAAPDPAVNREAVLRELLHQMRTDRERGA